MLAFIRKFAQSWVALILFLPLTIGFLLFGVSDVLHPKFSNAVVQAGSHEVSPAEYKREFGILLRGYEQQTGQQVNPNDVVASGADQQILSAIEGQTGLDEYLSRMGVRPANYLVDYEINTEPGFANQLGQFDQRLLNDWLGQQGLTALDLKAKIRDDIAQRHAIAGLAAGLRTPKLYGALLASYNLEGRGISYFVLDPHSVPPPPAPTDAQLQAIVAANAQPRPEMRTLTVVRFSTKALTATMPVNEAEVQSLYAAAKAKLAQPEKRSLVEFATADATRAQTIAARLKAGEDPAAIGKALGVPPTALADKAKTDIVDPDVAGPAFAAAAGQVVGPVRSGLAGYAVVKVLKITPPATPTLDQLRGQLESEAKTHDAREKVFNTAKAYKAANDSGSNLADSARSVGATPQTVGPLSADGHDAKGQVVAGVTPEVLKVAFSLSPGQESELTDEGDGEYFAVRVQAVTPPAMPTLAEVRPQAVQLYTQRATFDRLNALADQLIKAVKKGETLEAAAASAHAQVKSLPNVSRQALEQGRQIQAPTIQALFSAKKGDLVSGPVGNIVAVIVARVDSIQPAAGADAARQAAQASDAFNDVLARDMLDAMRTFALDKVKPVGDLAAARAAIGVTQEEAQSGARPKRGPAL